MVINIAMSENNQNNNNNVNKTITTITTPVFSKTHVWYADIVYCIYYNMQLTMINTIIVT